MALLFTDGFDVYSAVANMLARNWTQGPAAMETTIVRTGSTGRSIRCTTSLFPRIALGANYGTIYIGVACHIAATSTVNCTIISFLDSGTQQATLGFNGTTGQFFVARGAASGTILNTGTTVFATGAFHFIEVKAQINSSIGANGFLVYVNGALEITVTTAADTNSTANNYCNAIQLGGTTAAPNQYFDDMYISDSGLYLTNPRIVTLYPNGNGNSSDFTGSDGNSTDNYALVNSTLYQTTTYTQSSTVNHRDLYTIGNLPYTPDTIHAVTVCSLLARDASGARSAKTTLRQNSVNYDGTAIVLSETATYYSTVYTTDPNTTAAWTLSGVNAIEAGVKVES